jgi:hypothetical protein
MAVARPMPDRQPVISAVRGESAPAACPAERTGHDLVSGEDPVVGGHVQVREGRRLDAHPFLEVFHAFLAVRRGAVADVILGGAFVDHVEVALVQALLVVAPQHGLVLLL